MMYRVAIFQATATNDVALGIWNEDNQTHTLSYIHRPEGVGVDAYEFAFIDSICRWCHDVEEIGPLHDARNLETWKQYRVDLPFKSAAYFAAELEDSILFDLDLLPDEGGESDA